MHEMQPHCTATLHRALSREAASRGHGPRTPSSTSCTTEEESGWGRSVSAPLVPSLAHATPCSRPKLRLCILDARRVDWKGQCRLKVSSPSELAELSRIAEKRSPPHSSDSGSAPGAARSAWFRRFEGSIECPSVKVNPTSQKWCVAATTAAACAERTELTTRRLLRRLVGISIGSMLRAQSLEMSNVEGWKDFGGSKCWRIYDDGRRRRKTTRTLWASWGDECWRRCEERARRNGVVDLEGMLWTRMVLGTLNLARSLSQQRCLSSCCVSRQLRPRGVREARKSVGSLGTTTCARHRPNVQSLAQRC